jgi:hypothetical protein
MKAFKLGYYAHSKRIYNKPIEKLEYDFIQSNFYGHCICPNLHIGEKGGIQPYLDIIKKYDVVYISEYEGFIGKGVAEECLTALEHNIPIHILKGEYPNFNLKKVTGIEIINSNNWIQYAKVILNTTKLNTLKTIN